MRKAPRSRPRLTEGVVAKEAMANAIMMVALALGLVIIRANGQNQYTGHVFRISGARHLARAMVQMMLIMLMARWDAHIILRYVEDATLMNITLEFKKGAAGDKRDAPKANSVKFATKAMKHLKDLEVEAKRQDN